MCGKIPGPMQQSFTGRMGASCSSLKQVCIMGNGKYALTFLLYVHNPVVGLQGCKLTSYVSMNNQITSDHLPQNLPLLEPVKQSVQNVKYQNEPVHVVQISGQQGTNKLPSTFKLSKHWFLGCSIKKPLNLVKSYYVLRTPGQSHGYSYSNTSYAYIHRLHMHMHSNQIIRSRCILVPTGKGAYVHCSSEECILVLIHNPRWSCMHMNFIEINN